MCDEQCGVVLRDQSYVGDYAKYDHAACGSIQPERFGSLVFLDSILLAGQFEQRNSVQGVPLDGLRLAADLHLERQYHELHGQRPAVEDDLLLFGVCSEQRRFVLRGRLYVGDHPLTAGPPVGTRVLREAGTVLGMLVRRGWWRREHW